MSTEGSHDKKTIDALDDSVPGSSSGMDAEMEPSTKERPAGAPSGSSPLESSPSGSSPAGLSQESDRLNRYVPESEIVSLREELAAKSTEAEEYLTLLRRSRADLENFRRRSQQERSELMLYAAVPVMGKLLPVLDNLERAIEAARGTGESGPLCEGVELILRQLADLLKEEGLEPLDPVGQTFDPQFHEAVEQADSEEHADGTILKELQRGYRLRGKILRPSLVRVARNSGPSRAGISD
ncbi:MAG: nucleotide exchange factor GrpE [Firmicutes bacterium]|nr:nucleotide exchange factor GrpE [Bacillota bacterium]